MIVASWQCVSSIDLSFVKWQFDNRFMILMMTFWLMVLEHFRDCLRMSSWLLYNMLVSWGINLMISFTMWLLDHILMIVYNCLMMFRHFVIPFWQLRHRSWALVIVAVCCSYHSYYSYYSWPAVKQLTKSTIIPKMLAPTFQRRVFSEVAKAQTRCWLGTPSP
jgi:hypothetical protein